jgi:arylformamidase
LKEDVKERLGMPKYIDLTVPFDGKFRFGIGVQRMRSFEKDGRQATTYTISAHAYTHIDAPLHMFKDGKSIDAFPVDHFIGEAALLDIPKKKNEAIGAEDMERAGRHAKDGDIVIIRTGWLEEMWEKEEFGDSPYLTEGAAEWLVKLKARMACYDFAIDYIERDFFRKGFAKTEDFVIHLKLLRNEVLNLENLNNLSYLSKPRVKLIAFPICLVGLEGAPCRAVAVED